MIKILICDDKLEWIESLQDAIKEVYNSDYDLFAFSNPNDLTEYLSNHTADIIFMDIQMLPINGIDTAKLIYKQNKLIQFIFTSVSKDYIQDVFAVSPVYYLTKPFNCNNVKEALELATNNLHSQKQAVSIVSKGHTVNLIINHIQYVESDKRIVKFHCESQITQSLMKLDEVSKLLPNHFVRCHQSYLVNIDYIKRISNNEIELYSGTIIPVAKTRFALTKKTILQYWEAQI